MAEVPKRERRTTKELNEELEVYIRTVMVPGIDEALINSDKRFKKKIAELEIKQEELPKHSFIDTFNKDESVIDDLLSESFNNSQVNESMKELNQHIIKVEQEFKIKQDESAPMLQTLARKSIRGPLPEQVQ